MPNPANRIRATRSVTCTDQVVGAILSGWRYDISGIPADLRSDYEEHLAACAHCRSKQRLHRGIDILLLAGTTLSFASFLLAALVMHKLEVVKHLTNPHLRLHADNVREMVPIPASITLSLEAIALTGVVLSMLLWILVAMATPVPQMLSSALKERVSPQLRDKLWKQAA